MRAVFLINIFKKESFMISKFRTSESVRLPDNSVMPSGVQVSVKGHLIPETKGVVYNLHGDWENSKYGWTFNAESYEEYIEPTENGIIKYLSSGQIRGIGITIAKRIYEAFGDNTLDILDQNPERLLEIDGIGKKKLERIIESYLANRGARDVLQFLLPFGITPKKALKLYKEYGSETIQIVKEKPYKLCELHGIGFKSADAIALKVGLDPLSDMRIDNAVVFSLSEAEGRGNTCLPLTFLIEETVKNLQTKECSVDVPDDAVQQSIARLEDSSKIVERGGFYFRSFTDIREQRLAENILKHAEGPQHLISDPHGRKDIITETLGFELSDEQLDAVSAAMKNPITVITGGPGTGKTAIQKAIITLFLMDNPFGRIICCSPTGKAARRMKEATGHSASTIHRAIGLIVNEDGYYGEVNTLEADLIIVDEVSMMDTFLADAFFRAIKDNSQRVVLVGDVDQLPSVGCGQVLKDVIDSNAVPVVRLEKVYRQDAGSTIAINAQKIRNQDTKLKRDDSFVVYDDIISDLSAQEVIVELYENEVARVGLDNVAFLTPFRQNSLTGVQQINPVLRDKINPPAPNKKEMKITKDLVYRVGDKVIQNKNYHDIANGDIGYITKIISEDNDCLAEIDFGDSRVVQYSYEEMKDVGLAYALTVHKAQGSEYKSVIFTLQRLHYYLMSRPIVYTAITRARDKVMIVGESKYVSIAIKSEKKETRFTGLLARLK